VSTSRRRPGRLLGRELRDVFAAHERASSAALRMSFLASRSFEEGECGTLPHHRFALLHPCYTNSPNFE